MSKCKNTVNLYGSLPGEARLHRWVSLPTFLPSFIVWSCHVNLFTVKGHSHHQPPSRHFAHYQPFLLGRKGWPLNGGTRSLEWTHASLFFCFSLLLNISLPFLSSLTIRAQTGKPGWIEREKERERESEGSCRHTLLCRSHTQMNTCSHRSVTNPPLWQTTNWSFKMASWEKTSCFPLSSPTTSSLPWNQRLPQALAPREV